MVFHISDAELKRLLEEAVKEAGSQKGWADSVGVSQSFVNDLLHGRREFSDSIARVLGYKKTIVYTKVGP